MKDSSAALGAYPWRTTLSVLYPAARSGIVTGLLLAVARISGETAPLLFTALNNQFWSTNLNAPMANLPVVIFQFALSPYKDWQDLAWAGALIITVTILILSISARVLLALLQARGGAAGPMIPSTKPPKHLKTRGPSAGRAGSRVDTGPPKIEIRKLNFFYGAMQSLHEHQHDPGRPLDQRIHRTLGLRQVDAAARAEPHVRAVSESARRGRSADRRPGHPGCRRSMSRSCATGSAWCFRSRRRFPCRCSTTSRSACARRRNARRGAQDPGGIGAARCGDLGRGQGQAACRRPQPVRRTAAAPVHRARDRRAARGAAAR